MVQVLATFPVWPWTCLTTGHLADGSWSLSPNLIMIYDPDSVSQLDIRPDLLSPLQICLVFWPLPEPSYPPCTVSLTWGTEGLVHDWKGHSFYWPPLPEGTALPLLHTGIELQQLNLTEALAEKQNIMLKLLKSSSFLGTGMLKFCKLPHLHH